MQFNAAVAQAVAARGPGGNEAVLVWDVAGLSRLLSALRIRGGMPPAMAPLPMGLTNAQLAHTGAPPGVPAGGAGFTWGWCSLIYYPTVVPNFGVRLHTWAATMPVVPVGHAFAGDMYLDNVPLSPPNAGLPVVAQYALSPMGRVDLLAEVPAATTLKSIGRAGDFARLISQGGASHGPAADGLALRGMAASGACLRWPAGATAAAAAAASATAGAGA